MTRREKRDHIFKLVFIRDFHEKEELLEQVDAYFEVNPEMNEEDRSYIVEKFEKVNEKIGELDMIISQASTGWKLDRMGKVELSILRLAVYEIKYDETVPVKVAIDEAVELSKLYCGDVSPKFVNGVLAKVV